VSKPPSTKAPATQTSEGATGEVDINDITVANMKDPKKASAVVAAIRKALGS
jgi:hypothetical protein